MGGSGCCSSGAVCRRFSACLMLAVKGSPDAPHALLRNNMQMNTRNVAAFTQARIRMCCRQQPSNQDRASPFLLHVATPQPRACFCAHEHGEHRPAVKCWGWLKKPPTLKLSACTPLLQYFTADSGHYMVTWTIRNGGWPRYVSTNLASLYRLVFGITDLKGVKYNDFKFIPNKAPEDISTADADDTQPLNRCCTVTVHAGAGMQRHYTLAIGINQP